MSKMATSNEAEYTHDEFTDLQEELEKAKENLKYVDENIKKLTGRDPSEFRFGAARRGSHTGQPDRVPSRLIGGFGSGRREIGGDGAINKRRTMSTFSRLGARGGRRHSREQDSGDEDELSSKPTVQSSVVANPKEQKTRKDCIEEQKPDARGLARNRRMFGLLLGTLQKFRVEEQKKQDKEHKRVEIEKKLEEMAEREKEELKKERKELFLERRKKQADLRQLEYKMELAKQLEEWERHYKQLMPFIRTQHEPHIFYLPAKHNAVSKRRLIESQELAKQDILQLHKRIDEEVKSIGKRRQTVIENEGEEMEEETKVGEPLEEGSVVPINLDESVALGEASGEYEEAKENFPILGDAPMMELGSELGNEGEGTAVPEMTETGNQMVAETKEVPLTDSKQEDEDKEMDTIDPNKLAEKEFEPIYD